jgi:cyclic lactone autoinducer peptide
MKKLFAKISSIIPALALMVGVFAVNSACYSYYHQPETPSEMDAYRK